MVDNSVDGVACEILYCTTISLLGNERKKENAKVPTTSTREVEKKLFEPSYDIYNLIRELGEKKR